MFEGYLDYRKQNGIDCILTSFNFDRKEEVFRNYPRGYCGVDKIGRPIYIERCGYIQPDKIWEVIEPEYLWKTYMQSYELVNKLHFMAASKVANKQIVHTMTIMDLSKFSVSMMNKKVYSLVQNASKIAQDNYPEQLGMMVIVNAPMLFTGVWAMCKSFVDEVTRKKIQILGSKYLPTLLEHIDRD